MLREKHNPYNGAFEKPGPELGSDSVYSKHNGSTQNREELHIVFRVLLPSVALLGPT